RRLDDRERRAGRACIQDEVCDRLEVIRRERVVRHDVVIADLGHAELPQVAADARLRGIEAMLAQRLDELVLTAHGRFAQDAQNRGASGDGLVNLSGHAHKKAALGRVHKNAPIVHKYAHAVNGWGGTPRRLRDKSPLASLNVPGLAPAYALAKGRRAHRSRAPSK